MNIIGTIVCIIAFLLFSAIGYYFARDKYKKITKILLVIFDILITISIVVAFALLP